ncbi:hypothetical protein [uncultured Desulfobacter sp.]|uniref:hypothetical protein n=1 Tax=uncultured Desulfobacter sp. TaxID=240139 RepID=UPI0029C9900B|nr:hypothetical protein [uncultured Desulfobacter sp.]
MAKSTGKKSKSRIENLNAIHPNAAGIDIGATEIYIAVPGDRSDDPVELSRDVIPRKLIFVNDLIAKGNKNPNADFNKLACRMYQK